MQVTVRDSAKFAFPVVNLLATSHSPQPVAVAVAVLCVSLPVPSLAATQAHRPCGNVYSASYDGVDTAPS